MKEKMTYEMPELDVVVFSTADVLTGSGDNDGMWKWSDLLKEEEEM